MLLSWAYQLGGGEIIILSVGLGGRNGKDPDFSNLDKILEKFRSFVRPFRGFLGTVFFKNVITSAVVYSRNVGGKLLLIPLLPDHKHSRVDVSEEFSADQLWFRILSGLFQRCSLPENLWTALIQRWKRKFSELKISAEIALFQHWFSLKQRWFRAEQRGIPPPIFE